MKKILIVEDEKDILEILTLYLTSNGFSTLTATNGIEALKIINSEKIDLMITDIMMNDMNGYELIRKVREKYNLPIIILSAKVLDQDRILGLDLGADAYITKPFNPLEVVAYVKASLRRSFELNSTSENIIVVNDLELNLEKHLLKKKGIVVPLTSYEYKIIAKLMANIDRIFTKTEIYECISDDYFEGYDNTMMVHISNLRSKIEDDPANPKYIITIRGLGYKFVKAEE